MTSIILLGVFGVIVMACVGALAWKYDRLLQRVGKVALKVSELQQYVDRVDQSTGRAIHECRKEISEFKELYGEAAVEEIRESAKAQKAWADGLNNIMSFGASLHGRGEET